MSLPPAPRPPPPDPAWRLVWDSGMADQPDITDLPVQARDKQGTHGYRKARVPDQVMTQA